MQSSHVIHKTITNDTLTRLVKKDLIGFTYHVRNHSRIYPWRRNRSVAECHLDNTRTPYTDKHNINEFKRSKAQLKPWMKVQYKDKDARFNAYAWNEAYTSDPVEAKGTAKSRLQSFQDSIRDRGQPRESKPYDPPADVRERVIDIYGKLATYNSTNKTEESPLVEDETVMSVNLNESRTLKFDLIKTCIESFEHDLPSSLLNDMHTVGDVVEYFSTKVIGFDPYTHLMQNNSLPPNLSFIAEPIRFDKETDQFFKGYNALPGVISKIPGLRARKKYPILNQDEFQWPDI